MTTQPAGSAEGVGGTPARLRPLNVGEAFDVGVAILRARFKALVGVAAVVVVPYAVLVALVLVSLVPDSTPESHRTSSGTVWATIVLLGVTLLMTTPLVNAVCSQFVASQYLDGVDVGVRGSLRAAARHTGTIVLLAVVIALVVGTGIVMCVLPGALAWVWWSLCAPTVVLEGLGPWAAMRRGAQLVRGRYWRTFATLLGAFAIMLGVMFLTAYASLFLVFALQLRAFVGVLVATGATVLVLLVWEPLVAAVTVVLYFDARVRQEGFDITWAMTLVDRGIPLEHRR